jgi:hypothetical protein
MSGATLAALLPILAAKTLGGQVFNLPGSAATASNEAAITSLGIRHFRVWATHSTDPV